jgi:hypothetical protein
LEKVVLGLSNVWKSCELTLAMGCVGWQCIPARPRPAVCAGPDGFRDERGRHHRVCGCLEIPLPPRSEQDQIAGMAEDIHARARSLMNAAVADLEKAKQHIKALILGKGA